MEMELHGIFKAFPKIKRQSTLEREAAPPNKKKVQETVTGNFLSGVKIYILSAGIGSARCNIFEKQITQNGGLSERAFCPTVTHVIVDDSMDRDRALRLLKMDRLPVSIQLVKSSWLSQCISEKKLIDIANYSLSIPDGYLETQRTEDDACSAASCSTVSEIPVPAETNEDDTSDQVFERADEHREEDGVSQNDLDALINGLNPVGETSNPGDKPDSGKWVCAQSSIAKIQNHNQHITDKLEVLAKAYTHQGDKWRALGYSKAINALKSYHKSIDSYEEACKIPGIGKRMADKIQEIMESGHLRKLDYIGQDVPVLELFSNIWGAGTKTAKLWYQQGFRTLEDISTKAQLNSQQKIGLKHYDDFLDRMPREEAAAIEKTVRDAAHCLNPGLLAVACGSYRRRKATCGDVDVLITHPDGKSHRNVFCQVLQNLHQSGFLTDDLVSHEENGEQKKYMGVCRLPGPGHRHRRLDVIVVPYAEFACSLLYFTGSAHFNRSMRALAKTKKMSLSEHSLNRDVMRQGSLKVCAGIPLSTPTERDVFTYLGIPYREPHERDW
ncbi:DNA polymerase lambda [Brienomyrus brachyistius]|uniref:DNA polymerase lambda n=1 Tax=Brienomyrus brachyistius TaxID=42636 RepID=UPI0020B18513|nr:DNA polymerase lambda [Brienomyrus brachyistius]